ncbi:exodeoxyribonuclease III [Verrucomicrobiota bacterium]
MKIATFNANSVRSRLDAILRWMTEHGPDVLCVQETKVTDEAFPAQPFLDAGYSVVFKGEKSYNGVALVSRQKPSVVRFGLDDGGPADETRLLYAKVGAVHVVNTYVPQGREIDHPMYAYKIAWFKRLKDYFDRHFSRRARVVWLGDMNVAPTEIDVHNPEKQQKHVCYHIDVREAFADTVAWGFVDVFREHHPEPGQYTFFDYRMINAARKGMGWRIDHIMATPPLAKRAAGAYIDLEPRLGPKPSDHTFLAAEFDD